MPLFTEHSTESLDQKFLTASKGAQSIRNLISLTTNLIID